MKAEKNPLKKLLDNDWGRRAVVILGLAGVALIFFSTLWGTPQEKKTDAPAASAPESAATTADYTKDLEARLTAMISDISGAGTPHVLVTLEQGTTQVYATEQKKTTQTAGDSSGGKSTANDSTETKYILVKDADGNERALAVTEQQPKVQGVVVSCPGAENPTVKESILTAVTTAVGVSSARVCIVRSDP